MFNHSVDIWVEAMWSRKHSENSNPLVAPPDECHWSEVVCVCNWCYYYYYIHLTVFFPWQPG